jgi:type I restriction enzyme M protein
VERDKGNLDIFWRRDESLKDSASLPSPDVVAPKITEDLKAVLAQFEAIEEELSSEISHRKSAPKRL